MQFLKKVVLQKKNLNEKKTEETTLEMNILESIDTSRILLQYQNISYRTDTIKNVFIAIGT